MFHTKILGQAIFNHIHLPSLYILVYIQNHPSVLIQSALHHEVFTTGALEAQVHRTSVSRAPSGKTK